MSSDEITMEGLSLSNSGSSASTGSTKRRKISPDASDFDDDSIHEGQGEEISKEKKSNILSFWLLGLCNNYAYIVMLSAAYDILDSEAGRNTNQTAQKILPVNPPLVNLTSNATEFNPYECEIISTGVVLLAAIGPELLIKLAAPWFADQIPYDFRIAFCVLIGIMCFVLVAMAEVISLTLLGVVFASINAGLGEFTIVSLASYYHKNAISAYSSGTGAASFLGAVLYAALTIVLSPSNALLIMIFIPLLEGVTFWCILERRFIVEIPMNEEGEPLVESEKSSSKQKYILTYQEKIAALKPLINYIVPLVLVFYAEYTINQGLFDLMYFPDAWLSRSEQYRWYQVDYQLAVFISRSAVNLVQFKYLWVLTFLQFANLAFCMAESVLHFLPSIWFVFAVVFFEGLLGGTAFVNTFYIITQETPPKTKEFSLGVTTISDSAGITIAGFTAIPIHNALCKIT